jgi:L-ascorbate metabolism protein UlaG (beta-lactamase superfamily)
VQHQIGNYLSFKHKQNTVYTTLLVIAVLIAIVFIVIKLPVFGRLPSGERLERIKRLPNYLNGSLQNISHTPVKPDGVSYFTIMKGVIKKNPNGTPSFELPHVKPDFKAQPGRSRVIWFGHSSYFIQSDGLNILVDPVFSKTTSPFSFVGNTNYPGTDFIHAEDFPAIDLVIISHDHYDHLDYPTVLKFKDKTKLWLTSIGVGSHLERWGIEKSNIQELAWGEEFKFNAEVSFRALSARHFGGRLFKRNQTLWSSFILKTPTQKLYLGGDSGYDTHFAEIGKGYGPFDLAVLECGQYDEYWPYIHMFPEQTVQAALELKANALLPVHWGKFTLANHDWNDPIERAVKAIGASGLQLTTPMLGESIWLQEHYPASAWWRGNLVQDKQYPKSPVIS